MLKPIVVASAILLTAPFAMAGPIDSACAKSDRGARSGGLCGCIQQVADMTLSRGDQRQAAAFFRNPDQAQQIRASKRDADNAFWGRYKKFATTAEAYCAR